jgi:hypothetical protein
VLGRCRSNAGLVVFLAAAVVLVQILPPALSDRYGERLITACTQGLREGACVLSSEAMGHQPSAVVAEVRWEDETFRVAEIRLGRLNLGEREWSSGKVAFDEGDAMDDRWTTAGFTIATLAGDLETRAERSATRPEAPAPITRLSAPVVAERSPAPSRQTPGVPLRLAAGYSVSQAMVSQPLRSGPWLAASYAPWEIPVKARVRAAVVWVNDSTASVRWTTLGAGLEARLPASRTLPGLLVAADVGPSLVTASANRQRTRVSASFNAFFGGDVSLVGPLSLVAGADLTAGPSTALLLDSGPMNDRRFKFGGIVGVVANL